MTKKSLKNWKYEGESHNKYRFAAPTSSYVNTGGIGVNLLWKCQSDIWPGYAQSQINSISIRKSSWDFMINTRATPTFPIVMYRSLLFLFLLPIYYNVNKGCGTTVNDMIRPLFPFTWDYIWLLCTLWSYVRVAFPKLVDIDPPTRHTHPTIIQLPVSTLIVAS